MPAEATQPSEDVFASGYLARNKVDGYTYQTARIASDTTKPCKARVPRQSSGHPGLYWEGTEEEFSALFVKV
jgi:hypothetical protein